MFLRRSPAEFYRLLPVRHEQHQGIALERAFNLYCFRKSLVLPCSDFSLSRQSCLRDLYAFPATQTPQKNMVSVSVRRGSPGHKRIMMPVTYQLPAKPALNPNAAATYNAIVRLLTLPAPLSFLCRRLFCLVRRSYAQSPAGFFSASIHRLRRRQVESRQPIHPGKQPVAIQPIRNLAQAGQVFVFLANRTTCTNSLRSRSAGVPGRPATITA